MYTPMLMAESERENIGRLKWAKTNIFSCYLRLRDSSYSIIYRSLVISFLKISKQSSAIVYVLNT